MNTLVKLTDNDKKLIIALLLILILLFVIFGFIGLLVKKIMTKQANKIEDAIYDVVDTGVIKERKPLIIYGMKKSNRILFQESWIPMLIMAAGGLGLLLYCIIYQNFSVDILDYKKTGIGTLFFIFDLEHIPTTEFFGIRIICDWPPVISSPHWSWDAWGSYIFFACMSVGGIWFLVCVQAFIARTYRLIRKSKTVFMKKLDNINPAETPRTPIEPE